MWKSAVHRSAIRSNASSKFLQNYAGRRVRQPRTPNTSAARVVANLIKLDHWHVKKNCFTLDSHMLTSSSFFSLQTQHDQSQGNTNTTNNQEKGERHNEKMCSLCRSVLCQVMWHSSSCSLNELLTPLPWADVSTGKLDSRFPVNKPQVLQIKVCWNYSSC